MVDCEFIEEPWLGLASFKAAVDSNPNGRKQVLFKLFFFLYFLGSVAVHLSKQHFIDGALDISIVRKAGAPMFEPGAAG